MRRIRGRRAALAATFASLALPLHAEPGPATVPAAGAAPAPAPMLSVELNKLESYDKGCRAYLVVDNPATTAFQSLKLDLVLFQPDGVIGRRFAIDLAPVRPAKKSVKLFDIEGFACDKVASVLVNDVIECKSDNGPVADCLGKMSFRSVAPASLTTK